MEIAYSKVTAQGRTAVPAQIRRKLGLHPGSTLEWRREGERIVICRTRRYTSEDIHRALFPKRRPKTQTIEKMKPGIRRYVKARHARNR